MKKKIEDLTVKQIQEICKNRDDCIDCPFKDDVERCFFDADIDLDKVIEVEENE